MPSVTVALDADLIDRVERVADGASLKDIVAPATEAWVTARELQGLEQLTSSDDDEAELDRREQAFLDNRLGYSFEDVAGWLKARVHGEDAPEPTLRRYDQ